VKTAAVNQFAAHFKEFKDGDSKKTKEHNRRIRNKLLENGAFHHKVVNSLSGLVS
jgi:hypothetical protein